MASIVSCAITTLSTVIIQEYKFLGQLGGELQSIKDEIQQMMDFLERADLLVQDHPEVRSWVAQVRDAAYDVEDVLDEFVMRCTYHHSFRWYGVLKKMYTKSVGAIKARHQLATRIQEIKKRIMDISESHGRYKTQYQSLLPKQDLPVTFSHVKNIQYDRRGDALLLEESDVVGIQVPKKELTELILNEDSRRNVISVVGMGGLGKTTLVKKVYDDVTVKSQFISHAWIVVSESFKLEELFKDTIKQLFKEDGRQIPQKLDGMKINSLKLVVKEFLLTKKYIVVFDDVWKRDHWDGIQLAFPKNQFGSRIVITTRDKDVGEAARKSEAVGSVYVLSPLDYETSKILFCRKAFPNVNSCPQHLKQICEKILRACGGLPLAIVVIGSSLAIRSQRTEEWESFYKRLGVEMAPSSSLASITKLLSLSYHDLPIHLKNCLLYLSIFPEDCKINTDLLARLWIGEGFVERTDGMTLEEIAKTYLKELVQRSLVQVAATKDDGGIQDIRVHDIVGLAILSKATEHNITTIFHGEEGLRFQNKVRRFSIQGPIDDMSEQAQNSFKSIRTLYLCKYVGGDISESFLSHLLSNGQKLLKVLDLQGAQLEKFPNEIFKLFHLKYLSLENTNVSYVPKSNGMLQRLQYLILWGTHVKVVPIEIQKLQHLRHLIFGRFQSAPFIRKIQHVQGVRVFCRIGSLKSLQQLYYIEADQVDNIRVVTEIGKLIHLRRLGITKLKREDGKELCSSLGNLRELQELWVYAINEEELIDFQYLQPSDLPRLHRLTLTGRLEKCPELISSLNGLTTMYLRYTRLRDDPLKCLQDLSNLIFLHLTAAYEGESLCFKAGGFPKLKELQLFLLEELRWMTMEENALPSLQVLRMRACQSMEEIPTGIQYLVHLQYLDFANMSNEFVNKLENLDKQNAAYKRILQIPRVSIRTWTGGRWSKVRQMNKENGSTKRVYTESKAQQPAFPVQANVSFLVQVGVFVAITFGIVLIIDFIIVSYLLFSIFM